MMQYNKKKILCILPAHNEQENIVQILDEVRTCGYDFVVIDDASSDLTADIVHTMGGLVLSLPINLGVGGAVQTGFLYAMRHNYDYVVQIDGDGQHDPRFVEALISHLVCGEADCVVGSRYMPSQPDTGYKTPLLRRLGMRFCTWVLRFASGLTIYDTTSGFRALNRRAFEYFAKEYPVDHPEVEALLLLHQQGFRVLEVPTRMRQRTAGTSLFTFTNAVLYPLRVCIGIGGILLRRNKI